MSNLNNTRALILVFMMPGCPACHEYKPRLEREVKRWQANGAPFVYHVEGATYGRGQIPIAIYDATSPNLQDLCDSYGVSGMPTTVLLTHNAAPVKLEGAIDDGEIYDALHAAVLANR